MIDFPDIRGFEMANHIESTVDRLIILWFSQVHRDIKLWKQVQVTLVNARLKIANITITDFIPKMKSYEIIEGSFRNEKNIQFNIKFDDGILCFECEDIVYSEYSRKIYVVHGNTI
jgi:hypothetical protein